MKIMTSHENLCGKKILLRPPKERCICHGHFSFHEEARARATIFRFAPWWVSYLGIDVEKRQEDPQLAGLQPEDALEGEPPVWALRIFHILKLSDPIARVKPRFKTLKINMGTQKLVVLLRCFEPLCFWTGIFRWTNQPEEFSGSCSWKIRWFVSWNFHVWYSDGHV